MISKHSAQYSVMVDKIKEIVKEHLDLDALPGNQEKLYSLGADSLDYTEIELEVEEVFGIEIPRIDWITIQDLAEIVRKLT